MSLFLLAACGDETIVQPTVVPLSIVELTEESQPPTETPSPAPTATQASSNAAPLITTNNCTPRTDWVMTYTVKQGETLSTLADWAATSVDVLAQGNCISNPNQLRVGQVIRVPIVPSPTPIDYISPTPLPTGGTPPKIISFSSNVSEAATGEQITISWQVEGADQGIYLRRDYRDTALTTAQAPQDWENLAASGTQTITFGAFAEEAYILTLYGQNTSVRQELIIKSKDTKPTIPVDILAFSGLATGAEVTLTWEVEGTDIRFVSIRVILEDGVFGEWINAQPLQGSFTMPIPSGVSKSVSFMLIPITANGTELLPHRVIETGKHQITIDLP